MLSWASALKKINPLIGTLIVALLSGVVIGTITIVAQAFLAESMASFRGTSQGVFFHATTTKSSEFWSLGDAYLCIPPIKLAPPLDTLIESSAGKALCNEGGGTNSRRAVSLGDDVSLSLDEPASVAVRVHTPGQSSSYLVINAMNPPGGSKDCKIASTGHANVRTNLPGAEKFALPMFVELRVAISKPLVLPYSGLITVGGRVADDRSFLLNGGIGAIYLEDGSDLHMVKQSEIFPGDTVRFVSKAGCEIASTGFVRLDRYGDTDALQVISSARTADAKLSIERIGTRSDADGAGRKGEISVEANQFDRLFNSGWLALLGAGITALVLCIELYSVASEYLTRNDVAERASLPHARTILEAELRSDGRGAESATVVEANPAHQPESSHSDLRP
jgi:hypothetical protein